MDGLERVKRGSFALRGRDLSEGKGGRGEVGRRGRMGGEGVPELALAIG